MKILSIETSCDETAVSIVEARGGLDSPVFTVLGNAIFSQIELHKQYGGVFPMMAKREHAKKLPILLKEVLLQAKMYTESNVNYEEKWNEVEQILEREEGLYQGTKEIINKIDKPNIDIISVTSGPGLEPALWVGISFANALGKLWDLPVVPANHMEGHITSILTEANNKIDFPAIALLISGGHTEIVEIPKWGEYKIIGHTVDDAVGEAFDKVARILGLPYPGGPEISKLAEIARVNNIKHIVKFPRPMINSKDNNFSFSGLKTSALYYVRDHFNGDSGNMTNEEKADFAREFEDAVVDVLTSKISRIIESNDIKTLIIAGGVIANKKIRETFSDFKQKYAGLEIRIPTKELSTDNSVMIAYATYIKYLVFPDILNNKTKIIAQGNLKLK